MTEQEFDLWLRSSQARRCAIVEVDSVPPRYFSDLPYATRPDDATPNRMHIPRVAGGVAFTESLAIGGSSARSSFGDIELDNADGRLDSLFAEDWRGVPVRVYIGDVRWQRADFRLVLAGVADDIDSRSPDTVNIILADKLQRLAEPITDTLIGGDGPNAEQLVPVTLGECHNVTPKARDKAGESLVFHARQAERLIESRNRGEPKPATPVLAQGRYTIPYQPHGPVTASVQGDAVGGYVNTVAGIVQRLATQFGTGQRFTATDLDAAGLAAFNATHTQPVGIYAADRMTVLDACQQIAESVGAQAVMSRLGLLRLLAIEPPSAGGRAIRPGSYELNSLRMVQRVRRVDGVRIGYCRNWSPGSDVTEGLPPEHAALYAQEWLTRTAGIGEPEQQNTLLLRGADAQAEAARRLALWGVQRHVYSVTGGAELLTLDLGQGVTLYGDRWGLQDGKPGIVTSLRSDWMRGSVAVEVLC